MKAPIGIDISDVITSESITQKLITSALTSNSFIQPVTVVEVNVNEMTVHVKPLLLGITTDAQAIETSVIYNVPYIRTQSGDSAIIIDPSVGDIGLVLVCDKDISIIKKTKGEAAPASLRVHSLSDSVYLCGMLNKEPKQFIKFTSSGIEINSPAKVNVTAPSVTVSCDTLSAEAKTSAKLKSASVIVESPVIALNGNVTAQGLTINGMDFSSHTHGNVTNGKDSTGVPQ